MPGLFSPATLERIRAASDIVDVIGSYLPLKRAGANFVALCPFHKEKTPSFNVNPHRQIFHCFGCHKGGDVFTFVREYESIDFVEAVKRLADRAKIPLEYERGPGEQQVRHLKDSLLQIHEQITGRWQNALRNDAAGQIARDYLAKRGVQDEAVKLFRLGYAPDLWDDTVNWAKSKGHELALVEKAGLIIRKEETGNYYDRFRGRLMFPICDEQGRVIGFSGRVLAGDEKTAKYVNSPETPIFTKGKVFFGLDKARRAMLDEEEAIICEGQLDLIACHMAGVKNVIAPQGTALTADHARILRRYVDLVAVCFDADTAGWNAAIRSLDPLLAANISVLVAVVPAPHDPDSFIRAHGPDGFKKLIADAPGFFEFYLDYLCKIHDASSDKGRTTVVRSMAEALHKTGSAVQIDTHAQKTALRLGVSADAVRAEFKKLGHPRAGGGTPAEESFEDATSPQPPSPQERQLLKLLFLHEEFVAWTSEHLDLTWIQHALVKEIVSRRLQALREGSWSGLAAFLDECDTANMQNLITEAATEERSIPNPRQQLADVLVGLRNQFIDRQLAAISQRAGQPSLDDAARIELLRQQQSLRQLKRQPIAPP